MKTFTFMDDWASVSPSDFAAFGKKDKYRNRERERGEEGERKEGRGRQKGELVRFNRGTPWYIVNGDDSLLISMMDFVFNVLH